MKKLDETCLPPKEDFFSSLTNEGLFNAMAYAGAGFLFLKLNRQGYKEEVKRYNQALEKLAKANEKFYESELKRTNDEARRRAEIVDANKDIEETNRALEDLRNFTRLMDDSTSQRRPKLEDYYQSLDEMKTYAMMTMDVLGGGGAYGLCCREEEIYLRSSCSICCISGRIYIFELNT
ncbi:Hypothetical predicted protein [Paramuricea clavata]|uniref:Uncharacterized protein n=1 Tax=Paramuricea clavata TaxID=317549 RepID=A0A7D9HAZ5_PARCT|nr:Hypothetical predicted protein [Paramuricea clavata]